MQLVAQRVVIAGLEPLSNHGALRHLAQPGAASGLRWRLHGHGARGVVSEGRYRRVVVAPRAGPDGRAVPRFQLDDALTRALAGRARAGCNRREHAGRASRGTARGLVLRVEPGVRLHWAIGPRG